ncbi:hypothetical protein C8J57DRAFT_1714567 [Mycena rebaudengoi]|nr:hypothetical protein C8J57DRAFT_1714567 [Mycena rebaudengoi]
MPPPLKSLIQYTIHAASTVQEIAKSSQIPFLASAATLSLAIVSSIESVRSNREQCAQLAQQIHEILCLVVEIYSKSDAAGALPAAVLYDIAKFTETLQKIYAFVKSQQGMGKLKQLFKQTDNAARLQAYRQGLTHALEVFKVQIAGSSASPLVHMRKDAEQRHEELLALLAEFPDLTNSDYSSETGTVTSLGASSVSLSMLPPYPHIFHGRDSELRDVVALLMQDSARVALLGTGGIGKTSLATAALHHTDVVAKYSCRYYIPCQSSATCGDLVSTIADHIGLEKGPNLSKKIMLNFKRAPPTLLILDNLETPWEPLSSRHEVETFLCLLADVPYLGLLVTMRGAERPADVKWSRPFLTPLAPLADTAAFEMFYDIADCPQDESVQKLLDLTGNLPLAISLIASVASHEGCDNTLSRWVSESTRMISDGYDKKSSLDISIMLSFTSSRMTSGAQELLSILSMLPDGLKDSDLIQAELPIHNVLSCKTTLLQTSLAFMDEHHQLKVLVPIREHILSAHPPTPALKLALRQHFSKLLHLWNDFRTLNTADIVSQISRNLGNLHSVLADSQTTDIPDPVKNLQSILFLNDFCRKTQGKHSPLLLLIAQGMAQWQGQPIFGDYLIQRFETSEHFPVVNAEVQIHLGNEYFESRDPLERAKWNYALGIYHDVGQNNRVKPLECFRTALSLSDMTGRPDTIGAQALCGIALMIMEGGDPLGAYEHAQKGQQYAELLGDIQIQARAVWIQAKCQTFFANYKHAQILLETARDLLDSCGLQGCRLAIILMDEEAEIHRLKTQYFESRAIHASIVSSPQSNANRVGLSKFNITLIDAETDIDVHVVRRDLETCRLNFVGAPSEALLIRMCDLVSAELSLREGDLRSANSVFTRCYLWFRDKFMEGAMICVEHLSDLSHGMNDVQSTLNWAGLFLRMALKTKNKLATMQAFRCLGQVFVAEGDENTALSLFNLALDGMTYMDVHRWRADCMLRIADILEHRGEVNKSVALRKIARPLFHRSSQAKAVACVDAKLAAVDSDSGIAEVT